MCALKFYFAAATQNSSVCEQDRVISVERGALHPYILHASCPCAYVYVWVCAWAVLFFGFVLSSSVNCFYAAVRVMSATWCFLLFSFEIVLERIALASVCVCMSFPITITHSCYVQNIYKAATAPGNKWFLCTFLFRTFPRIYLTVCGHPLRSSALKIYIECRVCLGICISTSTWLAVDRCMSRYFLGNYSGLQLLKVRSNLG